MDLERRKEAELVVESLRRQYEERIVGFLDGGEKEKVPCIPTGILSLDRAVGIGGLPRGRIVEIFGPESGGKSLVLQVFLGSCQSKGYSCLYIDAEHSFEASFARKLGVDVENLLVSQPDYLEQALDVAYQFVESGTVDVVGIDSISALPPKKEIEGSFEDQNIGLQARVLSQSLRKFASLLSRQNAICVIVNQVREQMGMMWGSSETTPGGRALKHYASVRIRVSQIAGSMVKDKDYAYGHKVRLNVVKNKVAPPFGWGEFRLYYREKDDIGVGIDETEEILDLSVQKDLIKLEGRTYSLGERKIGTSRDLALKFLYQNPDVKKELVEKLKKEFSV